MLDLDFSILNAIQNIRCPFLDWFMPAVSFLANGGWFWIALAVVFLIFKKTRRCGIMMGVALLLGLLFGNLIIKNLVARARPYTYAEALVKEGDLLINALTDYSFPSGHTLASFNAANMIFAWNKRAGIPALILAAVIAFSRLYLYVHFPTDILGGFVLAIICSVMSFYIVKILADKVFKGKI